MTCEEVRREVFKVLKDMRNYNWRMAQEKLVHLYHELNLNPADIHRNYSNEEIDYSNGADTNDRDR